METYSRANTNKENQMEEVNTNGLMVLITKEILLMVLNKVMENGINRFNLFMKDSF